MLYGAPYLNYDASDMNKRTGLKQIWAEMDWISQTLVPLQKAKTECTWHRRLLWAECREGISTITIQRGAPAGWGALQRHKWPHVRSPYWLFTLNYTWSAGSLLPSAAAKGAVILYRWPHIHKVNVLKDSCAFLVMLCTICSLTAFHTSSFVPVNGGGKKSSVNISPHWQSMPSEETPGTFMGNIACWHPQNISGISLSKEFIPHCNTLNDQMWSSERQLAENQLSRMIPARKCPTGMGVGVSN